MVVSMKKQNFNLRGINPKVMIALKKEAKKQNISINILILSLIEKGVGYVYEVKRPTYHDLDSLAGTWSAEDEKKFRKNIEYFEKIDKDIWE